MQFSGDILGCLLNMDRGDICFYLNGRALQSKPHQQIFDTLRNHSGFFAAASFMSFQQCQFNFGSQPFLFAPVDDDFMCFNDFAQLSADEKMILPRYNTPYLYFSNRVTNWLQTKKAGSDETVFSIGWLVSAVLQWCWMCHVITMFAQVTHKSMH